MAYDTMMAILFFLVWSFFLALSVFLLSKTRLSLFKVSVIQIFLIFSFLLSFVGYPILFFQLDDYRLGLGLTDKELIIKAMIASAWSILSVSIVYWFLETLFSKENSSFGADKVCRYGVEGVKNGFVFFFCVFVFCGMVGLLYISKVEALALVKAFSSESITASRSSMTNDFSGNYHWYKLFFYDLAWVACLSLFGIKMVFDSRRINVAFWGSVLLLCFFLLMAGQKSPVVFFFGTLYLLNVYLKKNGVISPRYVIKIAVISVFLLVVIYMLFVGVKDLSSALSLATSRALTGQLSGAYNYQWIFPERVDFLLGRSFPNPRGIFPFEHYSLPQEVMKIVNPHLIEHGVVGTQPTMFWGEAYANFGWIGVLLVPFYVGTYIYACKVIVSFIKTPPIKGAATVWLGLQVARFAYSGFAWSMLPIAIIFGAAVFWFGDRIIRHRSYFY